MATGFTLAFIGLVKTKSSTESSLLYDNNNVNTREMHYMTQILISAFHFKAPGVFLRIHGLKFQVISINSGEKIRSLGVAMETNKVKHAHVLVFCSYVLLICWESNLKPGNKLLKQQPPQKISIFFFTTIPCKQKQSNPKIIITIKIKIVTIIIDSKLQFLVFSNPNEA